MGKIPPGKETRCHGLPILVNGTCCSSNLTQVNDAARFFGLLGRNFATIRSKTQAFLLLLFCSVSSVFCRPLPHVIANKHFARTENADQNNFSFGPGTG
jgi:hypothetical protein